MFQLGIIAQVRGQKGGDAAETLVTGLILLPSLAFLADNGGPTDLLVLRVVEVELPIFLQVGLGCVDVDPWLGLGALVFFRLIFAHHRLE